MVKPERGGREQTYMVDGNTFRYRIEGLEPDTGYSVSVKARTASGFHDPASAVFRTDDDRVPSLVRPPRITNESPSSVDVSWEHPFPQQAVTGYQLEYRNPPTGAWRPTGNTVPSSQPTHGTIRGLPSNTDVEVRVRALGRAGRKGEPSPHVAGRTRCDKPDIPPQGIRLDAPSPTAVRVTWARPAKSTWACDHLGVELWYQNQATRQEQVVKVGQDASEYTIPSAPHTSWSIKLRSTNAVGPSPWSETYRITTEQGAPGAVRGLVLTPLSPNEVRVNWRAPLEKAGVIVGYDVSYRLKHRLACPEEEPQDVSRDWITVYNVKDLDYTLTGLLPFSMYEVKVRARTTRLGPEETKSVSTLSAHPSAPPLDLRKTYGLERSLSFAWQPIECSQRHGHITNFEYEILGQDDWAKLERRISNTTALTVPSSLPPPPYPLLDSSGGLTGGHRRTHTFHKVRDAGEGVQQRRRRAQHGEPGDHDGESG